MHSCKLPYQRVIVKIRTPTVKKKKEGRKEHTNNKTTWEANKLLLTAMPHMHIPTQQYT
jgi:hypothetical protein